MEINGVKCRMSFRAMRLLPLAPTDGDLKVGLYLPKSEAITPIISLTPNLIHAAHHANRSGQGGEHSDEDLEEFAPVEVFHCD